MTGQRGAFGRIRQGAKALAFGNPLYGLTLGGRTPSRLLVVPPDPWPGSVDAGTALLNGVFRFAGQTIQAEDPIWHPVGARSEWLSALHGFEWLRDLRAVGGDAARRQARMLVSSWLERNQNWNAVAWSPEVLALRIATLIGQHDFYCASADDEFRAQVFESLARQARHLARVVPGPLRGAPLLVAIKGLAYAGVALPDADRLLAQALKLLDRELAAQILPDGGHVERSPLLHLTLLRHLIDLRAALGAARVGMPEALQHAIDRMTPALRFFRHGDGGLALFNGSQEGDTRLIDAVLAQADARGRPLKSAPHTGFERLLAGRTLVIMDTGRPSSPGLDGQAHAGTLSFELSVGRERLIVNCGAHPGTTGPWHVGLASTAAHSTLVVAETNSAEVLDGGGLGRRPSKVGCERLEADGSVLVDASHDGYLRSFGLIHRRRLYLDDTGEDLRGEDLLEGDAKTPFAIRFHLHPSVQCSVIQNGAAALLRLPSGIGWRLRTSGGRLDLEDSIYLGSGDEPRRTRQIVITGETANPASGSDGAVVKWALRREKKAP